MIKPLSPKAPVTEIKKQAPSAASLPVKVKAAEKKNQAKTPLKQKPEKSKQILVTKPAKAKKNIGEKVGWVRELTLGVINLVFAVALAYLLIQLPQRAAEVKVLRGSELDISEDGGFKINKFELDKNKEKADRLIALFPDEQGLLTFVDEIEKLKREGSVVDFSFASKDPVVDKTNNFGIPMVIELKGTWGQIDQDLQKIQKLPFLFRPVSFNAGLIEDEGVIDLRYGGFLYVDESLEKNR